jgi:hypothetical protein
VATQGRAHGSYWVTQYVIQYSTDGVSWREYSEKEGSTDPTLMRGNNDHWSVNKNFLELPFKARHVRINVRAFANGWPTLRWELYEPEHESLRVGSPLGIADGRIPDSAMTASSCHGNNCGYFGAQIGRLYGVAGYGGWMPNQNRAGEYLQVDLQKAQEIGGVATQGRKDGSYWVSSYWVVYSMDGATWEYVMRGNERVIFKGNEGRNSDFNFVVRHVFNPPILARYVRLIVHTFSENGWPCMRMELYAPHKSREGAPLESLGKAFGLEDKSLPDSALTASSVYEAKDNACAASNGRLENKLGAGGWVPQESNDSQWFQIATGDEKREVGGLALQGRASDSQQFSGTQQWVTSFRVAFSKDGTSWEDYKEFGFPKVFGGNLDTKQIRKVAFRNPFTAKLVRIIPTSWYGAIGMRAELYDTARYQKYLSELAETQRLAKIKEEEKQAALLREKAAAEAAAREAREREEKIKEKEAKDKVRADQLAVDNAKTDEAKAIAQAALNKANAALKELENTRVLALANSKKREAELKAKEIEAEQAEAKVNALIEEARAQRAKFTEAQKKLELLQQDYVELKRQGIEALRERTERLDEISEVESELANQQRLLVEAKRELKLLRAEVQERKGTLLKAHKEAQEKAYQQYLDTYNPFRRTGADSWPFPRQRMCTCSDTDDPTMKLDENH